jgi:hypothetical protein
VRLVGFEYENHDVIVHLMKGLINLVVVALHKVVYEDFVMYFDRLIVHLIDQFYLRFEVVYQFVFDDYFLDEIF